MAFCGFLATVRRFSAADYDNSVDVMLEKNKSGPGWYVTVVLPDKRNKCAVENFPYSLNLKFLSGSP